MKCFYHLQADAVGTCKNCPRALCRECAVVVENGLACQDRYEVKVQALNQMIDVPIAGTRILIPATGVIASWRCGC